MHKIVSFLLTTIAMFQAGAQTIRLHNLMANDPMSNTIYIGIENRLLIAPAGLATGVQFLDGTASLLNDTLILKPSVLGTTTVTLFKPDGKEEIILRAMAIPQPVVKLEGHNAGNIRLGRFQRGQKFILDKSEGGYWDNYLVERFAAAVNNFSVVNEGAAPGPELADAIRKSPKGTMLTITMLELVNTQNNHRETIRTTQRIVVN